MARSRSSFDLASAIATAASLRSQESGGPRLYEGVALVSFGSQEGPVAKGAPPPSSAHHPPGRPATPPPAPSRWPSLGGSSAPSESRRSDLDPSLKPPIEELTAALRFPFEDPSRPRTVPPEERPTALRVHAREPEHDAGLRSPPPSATHGEERDHELRPASSHRLDSPPSGPPRLPDLSRVVSPILRCERMVAWISEATGATDVFLADGEGLPLAGAIHDVEARLAGSGLVASSIASLVTSIPGTPSPIFEVHLGEGPFFQLIGFQVGAAVYIIGLIRARPLTPRQAQAIRAACRHALGATLGSGA